MRMKIFNGVVIGLFFATILQSSVVSAADCTETHQTIGKVEFQITKSGDDCWHSVSPVDKTNLIYRDFMFDSSGYFMAFSSYGDGPDSTFTGAREFFLFPRAQELSASISDNGVAINFPNGLTAVYSADFARWVNAVGAEIWESPDVVQGDKGGFKIRITKGLQLDFGFRLGGAPSGNRMGNADFRDAFGKTCTVRNTEVITWDADGDTAFKFPTDKMLRNFLNARCPTLKW